MANPALGPLHDPRSAKAMPNRFLSDGDCSKSLELNEVFDFGMFEELNDRSRRIYMLVTAADGLGEAGVDR
jgi:hypothetical protein